MKTAGLWIDGRDVPARSAKTMHVLNPQDDSIYAKAASGTAEDIDVAVESAHRAWKTVRETELSDRAAWLINMAELVAGDAEPLRDILIDEIGSSITKAQREIDSSVNYLRAAASATGQLAPREVATIVAGRKSFVRREPIGVIAGITPFNVPLIKGIKHTAMTLATGNTCVLLPSEEAPVLAHRMAELYSEAGVPDGAVNVVSGVGHQIGDALVSHRLVRMVSFTGSTKVGRHIQTLCGKLNKRVVLEMGGKNPLVVLSDADIDSAVQAAAIGAFFYQGQICISTSRLIVAGEVFDAFLEKLVAAAGNFTTGDLRNPKTMIGPIINERQRLRIQRHLDDAVAKGATVVCGENWEDNCCLPTILTDVRPDMKLYHEETFGPVVSVHQVESADEAIAMANDTQFGLCASVFSSDLDAAERIVTQLNVGMAHINAMTIQEEPGVPFGGVGDSGFGRAGTDASIVEMTEPKWITVQSNREG